MIRSALWTLLFGGATLLHAGSLTLEQKIPLPGVHGRIDHSSFDPIGDRIFVCALGNDTVEVIDLKQGKSVHSIKGLSEPQGIVFLPQKNRLYVANGGDGTLRSFDGTSYEATSSQVLGDDADNVREDETSGQIIVGYGDGGLAFVDPATGLRTDTVALDAHPESLQAAKGDTRIFVNVPGAHQIAVVDRRQRKVIATWSIGSASGNFPTALDEAGHQLFVGCRSPANLLIVDTESGKSISSLPLDGDCDDLFFDAISRQVFASCGSGFLDSYTKTEDGAYKLESRIPTAPGARTSLVAGRHLYLAVPMRNDQPAALWCYLIAH